MLHPFENILEDKKGERTKGKDRICNTLIVCSFLCPLFCLPDYTNRKLSDVRCDNPRYKYDFCLHDPMVKLVYLYTCQTMQPYTKNRYYSIENLREDIVTIRIEIIPCLLVWFYFIEHLTLYHVYY